MPSEGNVHFPSGLSILNPISLGGPLPAGGAPPPNLLGGYSMGPLSSNGPMASPVLGPLTQQIHPSSVLKVVNLPADLSQREAGLIFSLVSDDVLSIDLNKHEHVVTAVFKNPNTCLTAGRLLDGRFLFGQNQGPAKVEYDASLGLSSTATAFENLRLSNAGISPPSSHASQLVHQAAAAAGPHASASLQHGSGAPGIDNFQKRASIGNQRSRFLFSDPFAGTSTPPNGNNPGSIDLSDLTGKSLLLMKPNEGRDYDNVPRDPWASQSQGNIGFSSNPQTPGLSAAHNSYDWGSGASTNLPASANPSSQAQVQAQAHGQQQPHTQHGQQLQQSHSSSGVLQLPPFVTLAPADRRRTSSFFNGASVHVSGPPTVPHEPLVQVQAQQKTQQSALLAQPSPSAQSSPQHELLQLLLTQTPPTVASIISQGPTQQQPSSTLSASSSASNRNGPVSSGSGSQNGASVQAQGSTPAGSRKDVPDLSLLARVPPPANPADQNPPCNTLYVGNLPPDATETELRSLFAPQKGFRRLSFRTKNQSGSNNGSSNHNHGPMCFVEFEDVAHATIALAELYGRALPRPTGSNGKGGIRLSFSKNPLGVRGPGNPRRGSANPQASLPGGTSNGVGNYGYLNYH